MKVLDCTLRDGGYCNRWCFGFDNVKKIIHGLVEAGVDIIECGFLTEKELYRPDITKFNKIHEVFNVIPKDRKGKIFVCMLNYGEYEAEHLPDCNGTSGLGIRLAFHKKDLIKALEMAYRLKEKGYLLFLQPMVTLNYSEQEFLDLIEQCNRIHPYAFYIVDSFGVMKKRDLLRLFYLVEHRLDKNIVIGFHSHNNMQLSFSNAQTLADLRTKHELIIDCCIFGMGRGAGNLNTELFVEYLNDNRKMDYRLKPLLMIIDEILNRFYHECYWGYSLPNYLSAKHNTHPNYAGYLDAKNTLTVEDMDEIFAMMEDKKRVDFDRIYIEEIYQKYMQQGTVQEDHLNEMRNLLEGRKVLIIAPGCSSIEQKDRIRCMAADAVTISINFDYSKTMCTDYIFLSNLRRYRELNNAMHEKCIITSNIQASDVYLKVDYAELTNSCESVMDNAAMMLIKFLIRMKVKKILIAGLDGYSFDPANNFADKNMSFYVQKATFEAINEGMARVLCDFSEQAELEFVTLPKYIQMYE